MKNSKNLIALLLVVLMVASFGNIGVYSYTGTVPYIEGFKSLTTCVDSNNYTNNGAFGKFTFVNLINKNANGTNAYDYYAPVYGKSGKEKTDKAFKFGTDGWNKTVYQDISGTFPTDMYAKLDDSVKALSANDIFKLSFEILTDDFYKNIYPTSLDVNDSGTVSTVSNTTANAANVNFVQLGRAGTMQIMGSNITNLTSSNYALNKWYKIDIFLKGQTNQAFAYINGEPVTFVTGNSTTITYQPK